MLSKEPPGQQREHSFENKVRLKYLLFLPQTHGITPTDKWPLILYLHGKGERGANLEHVKRHGIAKLVQSQPDFPFVAVSPQCPAHTQWWEHSLILKNLLDKLIEKYAIDEDRVYLTGNSMGGHGAWELAIAYPKRFAAIAPICGRSISERVKAIKDIPVWAFHGSGDNVVPFKEGERTVETLKACGGNVRFTVYPGVGHDSWTQTYENSELYEWFLRQQRRYQEKN